MALEFGTFRDRLENMSAADQTALANAIKANSTDEVVKKHKLGNGAHGAGHFQAGVLPGAGRDFFWWHRKYLAEDMEAKIGRRLPQWRPWNAIPGPFKTPADQRGNVHDTDPPVKEGEFLPFCSALIGFWPNADALGTVLTWGPHFRVHVACGGDMKDVPTAPAAPIFWAWHAFIDDIFEDWLRQAAKRLGPPPLNLTWPWATPPSHAQHNHARPVPFVFGLKLSEATDVLHDHGFQVGETRSLDAPHKRVFAQKPLPLTLHRGSVSLSGRVETDWVSPFSG